MVALPACLLLALLVFAHGLGASSLFVDEAASWHAAAGSLRDVFTRVRADEVAPYTYYVFLHEWIYRFHDASEVWMRLPSMLAGVALVAAVAWLAYLISGRVAACVAALLAALFLISHFVGGRDGDCVSVAGAGGDWGSGAGSAFKGREREIAKSC